jgi:hypothetical protein
MPLNLWRACGQDFSGVKTFDRHRVGKHEYLWSRAREDGRRCLDPVEMRALGWKLNEWGRWSDPSQHPGERLGEKRQLTEAG